MPLDRRRFIASTGAALVLSPLAGASARGRSMVVVVVEPNVPESLSFAEDFSSDARIVCRLDEPLRLRAALRAALADGDRMIGCTREAESFVIGELLRGDASRLDIVGRHRHIDSMTLDHEIRSLRVQIPKLFEYRDWPRRLAAELVNPDRQIIAGPHRFSVLRPRSLGSPGYVTTWEIVAT